MDAFISNSPIYGKAVDMLGRMGDGRPNSFVIGTATTQRVLTVMHECARATVEVWKC